MAGTVLFVLALAGLLVYLGRTVPLPYAAQPYLAGHQYRWVRDIARGVVVIERFGKPFGTRMGRMLDEFYHPRWP